MDTIELQKSLHGLLGNKVKYNGVFTSDLLPANLEKGERNEAQIFIVNTLSSKDKITKMGHWVVFYVEKTPINRIVFFDSYGVAPSLYGGNFVDFVNKHKRKFIFCNWKRSIQPLNSVKCGLYVIYFVHMVSHYGIESTLEKSLKIFSVKNKGRNDSFVTSYFFRKLNRMKTGNICSYWRSYHSKEIRAISFKECSKELYTGN